MKNAGYQGGWMAENIAAGNETAAKTFEQWKNSPGHNTNMLGEHYRAIGIGRAYDAASPYRWYWTTDFGDRIDDSVNTPTDPPPPPPDPDPDPGACEGTAEKEPNDAYTAPNPLAGAVCGELSSGSDVDWYSWNLTQGAHFSVQLEGDAELKLWRKIGNYYYNVSNTTPTSAVGTASRTALYIARVRTSQPTPAAYRIVLGNSRRQAWGGSAPARSYCSLTLARRSAGQSSSESADAISPFERTRMSSSGTPSLRRYSATALARSRPSWSLWSEDPAASVRPTTSA
jgi:hypothetical protein